MKPLRFLFVLALLLNLSAIVICQSPPDDPEARVGWPEKHAPPDSLKKPLARRNVWVYEYQFTSEEKRLLEPSTFDLERASSMLRLSDSGLFRLYPWARRRRVISIEDLGDGRTPDFNAHASVYSFSKQKHGNGLNGFVDPRLGWGELKLGDGKFFTGFTGESLGVLVSLGDTPLEQVTPETGGVTGLTSSRQPTIWKHQV
jgi:hypothetical protein